MSEANPLDELADMAGKEPDMDQVMNMSLDLLKGFGGGFGGGQGRDRHEMPGYIAAAYSGIAHRAPTSKQRTTLDRIDKVVAIAKSYSGGITLRQLYYQLVSQNIIRNVEQEYNKLSLLVTNLRYWNILPWDCIVDRHRAPHKRIDFDSLGGAISTTISIYRRDWWKEEDRYIELWCEKSALAGILQPIADDWHVLMMVNKGYSSATAMYDAAGRFQHAKKPGVILYVGDHDPSGLDMVRDIDDRLAGFGEPVRVRHIALTMEQIKAYNLPPNPTKLSDKRSPEYVAEFGEVCWEADALPPDVLSEIVEKSIQDCIPDIEAFQARRERDKNEADKLWEFVEVLDDDSNGDDTKG